MSDVCGFCEFDKSVGLDYCSRCSRPLSVDALMLEYDQKQNFEERFRGVLNE